METQFNEYAVIAKGRSKALVSKTARDAVAAALLEGKGCEPAPHGGRGPLLRFPCGGDWGLVRPCRRGGVMRYFLKDAYFLHNRPLREFQLHVQAFERGLAVPEPLGVLWERHGLWFRGALATREIPAINLREFLRNAEDDAEATLKACGRLVREMHSLGIFHADLQLANLLVGESRIYLVDFDKARIKPELSRLERSRNLLRLRRSMEKHGVARSRFQVLLEGYGLEALPEWLGRIYDEKAAVSDKLAGRKADEHNAR